MMMVVVVVVVMMMMMMILMMTAPPDARVLLSPAFRPGRAGFRSSPLPELWAGARDEGRSKSATMCSGDHIKG